jgi:hypothetical protein
MMGIPLWSGDDLMDTWIVGNFCTLPTAARPLRVAEFGELFQDQIAAPRWIDAHRVEFSLAAADDLYSRASDLVARESACCSFFDFSITRVAVAEIQGPGLLVRVGVPASRHDVLEALADRAVTAWSELSNGR